LETLWQDIRFAFRTLRKSPGFTAIAVIALGLGIGANTAIFSVADAFLLKPVKLPDPQHLFVVLEQAPTQTRDSTSVAPANFLDWKQQATSFEPMGAWEWDDMNLTGVGLPEKVQGFSTSSNFFALCGVQPFIGRAFLPGEDQPGHDGVVVLSQRLWVRRFGSDPNLLGQTIHLDTKPYTVIGVMPRSFNFPMTAELWVPLALTQQQWQSRSSHSLLALARLKPGATLESANAEMAAVTRRLSDAYPATNRNWRARVMPLTVFIVGDDTRAYTFLLMGAVGFVLLIVCANVANLQFVRGASRQKEVAIRAALGGSRWRVMRQLVTESMMLGMGGAALGLVFAKWAISLILANMPADVAKFISGWDEIRLDGRALAFTILAAIVAGIVAGLLPALETTRLDVNSVLKEGGRSSSSGRGRHKLRDVLVITQVASAVVLLVGAGLIVRGFQSLMDLNQGYEPDTLLTMQLNLPDARYDSPQKMAAFYDQVLERLGALPGARAAGAATSIPLANDQSNQYFTREDQPWRDASELRAVTSQVISANYLQLMHISLVRGREFTDADASAAPGVVLVSQSMARAYWPNKDALGHRLKVGANDSKNPWLTIVGIVADVKMDWDDQGPEYAMYRPYRQAPRDFTSLMVRTAGDPMVLASAVRAAVVGVDAEQPIFELKPMTQAVKESIVGIAYVSVMMGVMGVMALVLAAVGVYGVMAFAVQQRTHEIGIRMALGAQRRDVLRLVVGGGLLLTAIGLLAGLPLSLVLAHLLAGLIYGIGATDPITFIGCGLILIAVAFVACWIPARRAMRTDPVVALRYE
jgi:putative ABC transport system permease protein